MRVVEPESVELLLRAQGESKENLGLMRKIDEIYTAHPFYGCRKFAAILDIDKDRANRLMRKMGIEAIYSKPRISASNKDHEIYPYLLRDVPVRRTNHVWSSDITYIPLARGFVYLVAVIDRYGRFVLAWRLSNTLEKRFCLEAVDEALGHGKHPEIFNTDQGSQFTSREFTDRPKRNAIAISMDGRGRALDNVFIERLWRSVKYEEVYLNSYASVRELERRLDRYFRFYNEERPHQSLQYKKPCEVYRGTK